MKGFTEIKAYKLDDGTIVTDITEAIKKATELGYNLFESYDKLPDEVKTVLDEYRNSEDKYKALQLIRELNLIGYTCDYECGAEPYNLRKVERPFNTHHYDLKANMLNRLDIEHRQKSDYKKALHFNTFEFTLTEKDIEDIKSTQKIIAENNLFEKIEIRDNIHIDYFTKDNTKIDEFTMSFAIVDNDGFYFKLITEQGVYIDTHHVSLAD